MAAVSRFKMQQSISSVQTVSCRGDFINCSPSKNTLFSASHNPSLPSALQSVLLSFLFASLGFSLCLSLSLTCFYEPFLLICFFLPVLKCSLQPLSVFSCPHLSLWGQSFSFFPPQARRFGSLWKEATKMIADKKAYRALSGSMSGIYIYIYE